MSIKVGIIGAGGMVQYHIPGFLSAGAEIVAIADSNPVAAEAAGARYGISRTYTDAAEMLTRQPEIDAVSVILPNKFHKPVSMLALQAGKHVFCEKPPALTTAEAQELKTCAEKAGKVLMFNFNNRARPESSAMMDYIRDGTVGGINSAQAKWIRRAGIPGFGGWFTTKALSGGGPLIDLLHMVDLAYYFMGCPEPEYVLARTFDDFITDKTFKGPWGIPDVVDGVTDVESAAHGFVKFKTGQALSFQASWAEMVEREEASVVFQGRKAGAAIRRLFSRDGLDDGAIDSAELFTHEHGRPVNRRLIVESDPSMGRRRSAANFIRSIEGTEKPLNSPDQAVSLMKIIDAAYESSRSGKPVEIR
ncbi:MAG: gfo/Idh/MocA family oxidoreductase [Verrucomicrobiaceae bacterium]|nr:MAG: gfo/Idh/MocA family oxidoreductase [Verrucomicrobiaceae bacterium]